MGLKVRAEETKKSGLGAVLEIVCLGYLPSGEEGKKESLQKKRGRRKFGGGIGIGISGVGI